MKDFANENLDSNILMDLVLNIQNEETKKPALKNVLKQIDKVNDENIHNQAELVSNFT